MEPSHIQALQEIPRHTDLTFTAGQRLVLTAKLTGSQRQPGTGSRRMWATRGAAQHQPPAPASCPRQRPEGRGCACCAGTGAETLLCLTTSSSPRCEDCAYLSGCLLKECIQFSTWKEKGLGLASSSNAAHIRIWGNMLNALPLLGAPRCCQVRAGDLPESAASYQRCASVTSGQLFHQ